MDDNCHLVFATPYYGKVANSKYGDEFIYTFVYVSRSTRTFVRTATAVWCGQGAMSLSRWLANNGVEVFFARDRCADLESSLNHLNIKSYWNFEGDIRNFLIEYFEHRCEVGPQ